MKQDIKERWLAALRSGEYPQAEGYLAPAIMDDDEQYKPRGFCCLGVLCEIAVADGIVERALNGEHYEYADEGSELPDAVQRWAGLSQAIPDVRTEHIHDDQCLMNEDGGCDWLDNPVTPDDGLQEFSLAELNDERHLNFDQIADIIERRL